MASIKPTACAQVMVAGYLKTTCGVQQMVSNGNEGYRVQGAYDPYASTAYPFNVRRYLPESLASALGQDSWWTLQSGPVVCTCAASQCVNSLLWTASPVLH